MAPCVVVIHHSPATPAHTMAHMTTFQRPTTDGAQNHCWCSVLLSAPTFCGHPSPISKFSLSLPQLLSALRLCFPLLTTCHVTAFTLFFTRRAPSQARRVTGAICTSCFHCLFNTASPLRLSHPLHAPPINRLPPRQQRVCNVGPSSSLHQRQAVVSV